MRMHVECGLDKDAYLLLPNSPVRWAIFPPKEREGVRERKEADKPLKLKSPMATTLKEINVYFLLLNQPAESRFVRQDTHRRTLEIKGKYDLQGAALKHQGKQ